MEQLFVLEKRNSAGQVVQRYVVRCDAQEVEQLVKGLNATPLDKHVKKWVACGPYKVMEAAEITRDRTV